MELYKLDELWEELSKIPTDGRDGIAEPFHNFPVGTHREHIWTWFEGQNPNFIVTEKLYK